MIIDSFRKNNMLGKIPATKHDAFAIGSLANKSQALKQDFFKGKEAHGNARPPQGGEKRGTEHFVRSGIVKS